MLVQFVWAADDSMQQAKEDGTATKAEEGATASGKPLPERVLPNLFKQREQDIKRYLISVQREDELVDLPSSGDGFSGYLLPERTGKPQGGVLILPDNGQHGHWPRVVGPLRDYLPDYGWATLTISLPDVPKTRLKRSEPTAAETGEETEENNTESAEQSDQNGIDINNTEQAAKPFYSKPGYYAKQMPERINSAYQYLNQIGQLNIVIIANGHSAAWAANWLVSQNISEENKRGFTLVIIDALDDAYAPVKLTPSLTKLGFPILDLVTPLNLNNELTNKKRAGAMRHEKHEQYQQVFLNSHSFGHDYSNEVNRTVRGWLSKNAAGMEGKVVDKD